MYKKRAYQNPDFERFPTVMLVNILHILNFNIPKEDLVNMKATFYGLLVIVLHINFKTKITIKLDTDFPNPRQSAYAQPGENTKNSRYISLIGFPPNFNWFCFSNSTSS